jgi:hypothetical protein
MTKTFIGEKSIETSLLYQKLSTMNPGETVSYGELSEIAGRSVQESGRSALNSARRMCERDDGKVFGVIRNEALKCLDDNEIVGTAASTIEHIKRTSRRGVRRMGAVRNVAGLGQDDQNRFNAYTSLLGVVAEVSKGSNIKKVLGRVAETRERLPYAKMLEALK